MYECLLKSTRVVNSWLLSKVVVQRETPQKFSILHLFVQFWPTIFRDSSFKTTWLITIDAPVWEQFVRTSSLRTSCLRLSCFLETYYHWEFPAIRVVTKPSLYFQPIKLKFDRSFNSLIPDAAQSRSSSMRTPCKILVVTVVLVDLKSILEAKLAMLNLGTSPMSASPPFLACFEGDLVYVTIGIDIESSDGQSPSVQRFYRIGKKDIAFRLTVFSRDIFFLREGAIF